MSVSVKTVLEVITASTDYLSRRGIESPRLTIEHLLANVLGKRRMDLYLEFDRPLAERELAPLRDLIRRRVAGEPLQYLLGTAEFLGHTLFCDKRALIPRPETEELCEAIIAESKLPGCQWLNGRIVDVGTGSGCIAIAMAAAFPEARVIATDISPDALALARENAARCGVADRIEFYESDLLAAVSGPLHLVIANLPYIPSANVPGLQREVLHEPALALDGGPDGLGIIRRLVTQCRERLSGRLGLELHLGQAERLAAELATENFRDTVSLKDYTARPRFLLTTYG